MFTFLRFFRLFYDRKGWFTFKKSMTNDINKKHFQNQRYAAVKHLQASAPLLKALEQVNLLILHKMETLRNPMERLGAYQKPGRLANVMLTSSLLHSGAYISIFPFSRAFTPTCQFPYFTAECAPGNLKIIQHKVEFYVGCKPSPYLIFIRMLDVAGK